MRLPNGITGSWKNPDSDVQFTFTKDGEFYINDRLEVIHQATFERSDNRPFIRIPEIDIPFAFIWSVEGNQLTLLVSSQPNPEFIPNFDSVFTGFAKRIFYRAA